jgi:hypothetical protein
MLKAIIIVNSNLIEALLISLINRNRFNDCWLSTLICCRFFRKRANTLGKLLEMVAKVTEYFSQYVTPRRSQGV